MKWKVWASLGYFLLLIYVVTEAQTPLGLTPFQQPTVQQVPLSPEELQLVYQAQFEELAFQRRLRLEGWRQYYRYRSPLKSIPFLMFLLFVFLFNDVSETACGEVPGAEAAGLLCCPSFTTQAECESTVNNVQCSFDQGTCGFECSALTTEIQCTTAGCTYTFFPALGFGTCNV